MSSTFPALFAFGVKKMAIMEKAPVSKIAFFSPFSYDMISYRLNLADSSLLVKHFKSLKFRTPFPTFSLSIAESIVKVSIKINLVSLKLSLFVKAIQLFYRDARLKGRLVF